MSIKNVCLLGADGSLGPSVLHALVESNFKVTVLKRAGSKSPSNYPQGVEVATVGDQFEVADLAQALRGQDALVITIKGTQVDIQKRLAEAAVQAGVKRLIPADYGSCDSSSDHAQACVPLFENKTELRSHLIQLAQSNKHFSWTALVCGHFFDWETDFLHIYPKDKRADILDNGDVRASYSTLARVGEAVSKILQKPAETANKVLFMQSFCVTQRQIIQAFEQASGSQYAITPFDAVGYEREMLAKRDEGDKAAIEELVWLLGALESNWEVKEEFAMELLGLQDEDLGEVIARILEAEGGSG
jgi:putative NADH-flavin reductase